MKIFKSILLISFSMLFIFSCVKDQLNDYTDGATRDAKLNGQTTSGEKSNGNAKVNLCHYDADNGTWHVISVNQNAVPAHLAHGDVVLVDADSDGWVAAENECVPGGDCNDANAAVNPGAGEVCDNGIDDNCNGETDEGCCTVPFFNEEILNSGAPFGYFIDSEVENCTGAEEIVYISSPPHFYFAYAYDFNGTKQVGYAIPTESGPVSYFAYVGVDITEADYECTKALLRAALAAHPGTFNYCDYDLAGNDPSAKANRGSILKNIELSLPVKLQEKLGK